MGLNDIGLKPDRVNSRRGRSIYTEIYLTARPSRTKKLLRVGSNSAIFGFVEVQNLGKCNISFGNEPDRANQRNQYMGNAKIDQTRLWFGPEKNWVWVMPNKP